MKNKFLPALVISLICTLPINTVFAEGSIATNEMSLQYRIQSGDALSISVWGEDTMTYKDLRVLPDGTISYPLTGVIEVRGKSTSEIGQIISNKLKDYIPDPHVTVIVSGTQGNNAYILGKVEKSGPIQLIHDMTVLQALSMSGSFDKFADKSDIKIIRMNNGIQEIMKFDYDEISKGKNLESNIILKSGDTILIP